jgi:hypothetical protein
MNGHRAYQHYLALKKHFTTAKYNVFEEPRVKIPEATFMKRNDRALWEQLAQSKEPKEVLDYMVANFLYGNPNFLYDKETAEANYTRYLGNRGRTTYMFWTEYEELDLADPALYEGCPPDLLNMYLGGRVSLETLCILSNYRDFLDDWESTTLGLFEETIRHIKKSRRFIKFNKERVEQVL